MKQRKAKTAMGSYCFCGSREYESFMKGGAASLEPAEGCTEFSPKELQQDYEDLIYLLGGETRWLHIESQD